MYEEDVPIELVTSVDETNIVSANPDSPNLKKLRFVGLTKDELDRQAGSKKWRRIRFSLFVAFWAVWAALLVAAILLLVKTPKCARQIELEWYQRGAGYSIEVRSLLDTDSDGYGDIEGVTQKLDYIKSQGYAFFVLSKSILSAGDPKELNAQFGNVDSVRKLQSQSRNKGLKVVLELNCCEIVQSTKNEILREAVDYWLQEMRFDGILMRFAQGDDQTLIEEIYEQIDLIGRKALKPKALIIVSDQHDLAAHLLVRNIDFGDRIVDGIEKALNASIAKPFRSQKPPQIGYQIDSIYEKRAADKLGTSAADRQVGFFAILTTLFTSFNTPLLSYGTEIMIESVRNDSANAGMPLMAWEQKPDFYGFTNASKAWISPNLKTTQSVQAMSAYGSESTTVKLIEKLNQMLSTNAPLANSSVSLVQRHENALWWKLESLPYYPSYLAVLNLDSSKKFMSVDCAHFKLDKGCSLKLIFDSHNENMTFVDQQQPLVPIEGFVVGSNGSMLMKADPHK